MSNKPIRTIPAAKQAPDASELLTPAALRKRWSVSNMFLWRARAYGRLPALKLGKHVRFRLADVEAFERQAQA